MEISGRDRRDGGGLRRPAHHHDRGGRPSATRIVTNMYFGNTAVTENGGYMLSQVHCPRGTVVTGGGFRIEGFGFLVENSTPFNAVDGGPAVGWSADGFEPPGNGRTTLTAVVMCAS
ncbi:hypothetical protein [Kitasatospora griseola]|uniref:hypothetical protein n=1 Tax=Kitasatospora griseola TaxID=2064 RepID=UPI0036504CF6